jgi:hypothetical protein
MAGLISLRFHGCNVTLNVTGIFLGSTAKSTMDVPAARATNL